MTQTSMAKTLAAASLMLLAFGTSALACSCVRIATDAVLAQSQVAFRGRVVATRIVDGGRRLMARVVVTAKVKSHVPSRMIVTTSNQPGLCGYPMIEGRVYLFAGSLDDNGELAVNMCSMVPLNSSHVD
jgi:hypothetical protein